MRTNGKERRRRKESRVDGLRTDDKRLRRAVVRIALGGLVALGATGAAFWTPDLGGAAFAAEAKKSEPTTAKGFAEVSQAEVDAAFEKLRPAPRLLLTD
ncbi:MAG: hypothetical protein IJN32_02075 [Thermoguttaceae bacterium]|nr:hypothetical protein [Thermoguttaceae bacterium]